MEINWESKVLSSVLKVIPRLSFLEIDEEKIQDDLGIPELDPNKNDSSIGGWEYSKSIIDSAKNSDAIIVITEWDEFKNIDWKLVSK